MLCDFKLVPARLPVPDIDDKLLICCFPIGGGLQDEWDEECHGNARLLLDGRALQQITAPVLG